MPSIQRVRRCPVYLHCTPLHMRGYRTCYYTGTYTAQRPLFTRRDDSVYWAASVNALVSRRLTWNEAYAAKAVGQGHIWSFCSSHNAGGSTRGLMAGCTPAPDQTTHLMARSLSIHRIMKNGQGCRTILHRIQPRKFGQSEKTTLYSCSDPTEMKNADIKPPRFPDYLSANHKTDTLERNTSQSTETDIRYIDFEEYSQMLQLCNNSCPYVSLFRNLKGNITNYG